MNIMDEEGIAAAFDAAKSSINGPRPLTELSAEKGISRSYASSAKIILEYGTAQNLADALANKIGLRTLATQIKAGLTDDQRKALKAKRNGPKPTSHVEALKADADLWNKFKPALVNLSQLPSPKDMLGIVKGNNERKHTVNKHIDVALKWLEDFSNEWTKPAKLQNNTTDSGGGNPAAGAQHPEPSSE